MVMTSGGSALRRRLLFSDESRATDDDLSVGGQIPAQRLRHGCGFRDADAELEISPDAHVACSDGFQPIGVEFALRQHDG